MKKPENGKGGDRDSEYTRRDFLKLTKNVAIGSFVVGTMPGMACINKTVLAIQASGGYLLVDTKKCQCIFPPVHLVSRWQPYQH